jgi:hypothetical protein
VDLETFLVSLYILIDDWWRADRPPTAHKPGRPPRLTEPEVLTLAVLAQWPHFRSERDFWRFAQAHLRSYFPTLCSQSQFNRRVRSLALELRAFQHDLARTLAKSSAVYQVLDTTLIPAIVRARAAAKGCSLVKRASGVTSPRPNGSTALRWRWW